MDRMVLGFIIQSQTLMYCVLSLALLIWWKIFSLFCTTYLQADLKYQRSNVSRMQKFL
nr:hypothetical protein Iba_scaffold3961.4CG1420 [Ipomoea batatas]